MVHFEIPETNESIIKVIGVGGGGGNAVNHMYRLGIEGVDFILCNTDSQALAQSPIPHKIQLGPNLTQGLGAGANPEVGRQAGEESMEEIRKILQDNTKMVFITAGMGGGTGTGAAPIIAQVCRELDILTVGIVTTPFAYEGRKRLKQAQEGINAMKQFVDTILIISNDKLRQQFGDIGFSQAFSKADSILSTAARCITDLITDDGRVNLDFNDVQTVMRKGGRAILGSALAQGEDRALKAVSEALDSPLLNDNEIKGAKWILLNITSGVGEHEHSLDELDIIQQYVQEKSGNNCDIILGMGNDDELDDQISVTIIATGFNYEEFTSENQIAKKKSTKIVVDIDDKDALEKIEKGALPEETVEEEVEPMEPRLSQTSERHQPVDFTAPNEKKEESKVIHYSLEFPSKPKQQTPSTTHENVEDRTNVQSTNTTGEHDGDGMTMSIRNTDENKSTETESISPRHATLKTQESLNELELEEEKKFEEAKRHLELRAQKLRERAAQEFDKKDDFIESVPAYQRQNIEFEITNEEPEDGFNSGYEVEDEKKSRGGVISTINSFLGGKRPD